MVSKTQITVVGVGAGCAVVLAFLVGALTRNKEPASLADAAASSMGLQVQVGEARGLDQKKPLRCFVNGQFVGMETIAACAQKNGSSAQSMDVGVDESGQLTAAPTASLAPPPAQPAAKPEPSLEAAAGVEAAHPEAGPTASCLRYIGGEWRQLSDSVGLNACVQALYAGRCQKPGEAAYGRWGDTVLRLVPGRVERSEDNKTFRTLVEQSSGCQLPMIR